MSLRMIARDLYRFQQLVDRLEKELVDCPPARGDELKRALTRAKVDRNQFRQILEGRLER